MRVFFGCNLGCNLVVKMLFLMSSLLSLITTNRKAGHPSKPCKYKKNPWNHCGSRGWPYGDPAGIRTPTKNR